LRTPKGTGPSRRRRIAPTTTPANKLPNTKKKGIGGKRGQKNIQTEDKGGNPGLHLRGGMPTFRPFGWRKPKKKASHEKKLVFKTGGKKRDR